MLTSDFDYALPEELIAQAPPEKRADSKMMVLDAAAGTFRVASFHELPSLLNPGDCIVVNNSRVIKARLFAQRPSGARLEILLLSKEASGDGWRCLLKPGKRAKAGAVLPLLDKSFAPSKHKVEIVGPCGDGEFSVKLDADSLDAILETCGHMPLPPYIKRADAQADAERYQTVYAKTPGSVAAPTAGLHFDNATLDALKAKGVARVELTLHVGQGTFKPVSAERVEDHKMHTEDFTFSQESAAQMNAVRKAGKRILAVGTTSLRVMESCVGPDRLFTARSGSTDIFIHPPQIPVAADLLLTNFHLPKSTLLMLVCAFAGSRELVLAAYKKAVEERLRFFSYGDCMLIIARRQG